LSQKQKRAHWLFSGTSLHKDLERCKESMALVTHLDETQFGNSWIVGQITQKPTKTKQTTQLKNTPNKNTNSKQKTNVMNTQTRVHAGGTNKRAHKHITTTRTIISQLMLCASHLRGLRADVALCEGGAVLRPTCVAPSIYLGKAKQQVQNCQTDVSRDIAPQVQNEMSQAYCESSQQRGTGTDIRQKAAVRNFVASRGSSLFGTVVDALAGTLDGLLAGLGKVLRSIISPVISGLCVCTFLL